MMPWLALPYEDEARVAALKIRFEIKALPTLVVLDSKGEKISEDARQEVTSAGQSEEAAKAVLTSWKELLEANAETICNAMSLRKDSFLGAVEPASTIKSNSPEI